jgi:predicted flavoprotein YhiN
MPSPELTIDLKPTFSIEQLAARIGKASTNLLEQATHAWRLSPAAESLLRLHEPFVSGLALARLTKSFPLKLRDPRPIAEAISTAGGVAWSGLDEKLMLTNHPGLFCAGEMLDWEAPTGGYLLQGCLATGTRAARGAIAFLDSAKSK